MAGNQILSLLGATSAFLMLGAFSFARISAGKYAFIKLNGSIVPASVVDFPRFVSLNLISTKGTKTGNITPSIRRPGVSTLRTS